jgi:Mg2+-importing ATPase
VLRAAAVDARLQTGLADLPDEAILRAAPALEETPRIDELPYDFSRKRLSAIARVQDAPLMLTKGAFESVLAVCEAVRARTAATRRWTRRRHRALQQPRFAGWSAQGFRVLGVAVLKAVAADQREFSLQDERGLVFLGLRWSYDPPKPDAIETIQALAALGVSLGVPSPAITGW